MFDQNTPASPQDIAKIAEVANDVLPQTVSEADGAISTIVGLFNNVVLYPIKKANITFRYKLERFEKDLREELKDVPTVKICEPKLMVAGPAIESLRYAYDEPELREMYLKLLASSMNTDKTNGVHPSFVDIIRQMDSADAELFQVLSKKGGRISAINADVLVDNKVLCYGNVFPEWFIGWHLPGCDLFQTSESLIRLGRLGIIQLEFDKSTVDEESYNQLINNIILEPLYHECSESHPDEHLSLSFIKSTIYVNEFGRQFAYCCL